MLLLVVAIVVVVVLLLRSGVEAPEAPTESATSTPELGADALESIQGQLEGINVEDVEVEFKGIDEELNQL